MTGRIGRSLLVLVLLLALAFGLCEWAGWPFLRGPIERKLSETLQRPVSIGDEFELRVLGSIRVSSNIIQIGAAEGAPAPEAEPKPEGGFFHASNARVEVPYSTVFALIGGNEQQEPPLIRSFEVERFELALARTKDGKVNWTMGTKDPAATDEETPIVVPRFERLVVQDGHVVVEDEVLDLQLQATIRTNEGSGTEAPGTTTSGSPAPQGLEVDVNGSYRGETLEASLRTSGVLPLIAATQAGSPPLPVKIDARLGETKLALEGRASDLMNLSNLEGSFHLDGPSLAEVGQHAGLTLPSTARFQIHGTASKRGPIYATTIESLQVGSSRLSGKFEFDPTPEVPKLTGELGGKRLALTDLAPAFGAASEEKDEQKPQGKAGKKATAKIEKAKKAASTDGRVLPQGEFDLPALGAMEAEVDVNLESANFGTDLLQDFTPLRGHLSLRDQVLTVDKILARTAGGELRGSFSLDARKEKAPLWKVDLNWGGIRLERFITARNPRNTQDRDKADGKGAPGYITGTFGGRAKLAGAGNSTARMLASLDGAADLWVTDGTISHLVMELMGIDVAQSLGLAFGGDQNLEMRCAVTRLEVKDGLLRPEVAVIDTEDTTVMVNGEVSLAEERLDLTLSARPKDVSPVALRAPVHVRGSFAEPAIRPDTATIGLRLAGAAVLAAITPVASLLALFDTGDPNTAACAEALEQSGAPRGEGTGKSVTPEGKDRK
jgi:uncharacterized protein involved in outer membrane biogenesis